MLEHQFYCLPQSIGVAQLFANVTFEPRPTLFNPIETGGIRRQVDYLSARRCNQLGNPAATMKGGIIHNHLVSWLQHGNQAGFEPSLKHRTVARSLNDDRYTFPLVLAVTPVLFVLLNQISV